MYQAASDALPVTPAMNTGAIDQKAPFANPVAGLTGRLALDLNGRVRRDLDFAQINDGEPQPLDAGPSGR